MEVKVIYQVNCNNETYIHHTYKLSIKHFLQIKRTVKKLNTLVDLNLVLLVLSKDEKSTFHTEILEKWTNKEVV